MSNRNYISRNTTTALPILLNDVMNVGHEVGSRNGRVRELDNISVTLSHPEERYLQVSGRKHNLAAQIAETMWVLAGRNDMEFLSNYLPRAIDYSDDGETWRAGYGARIRDFAGGIDQLRYVIDDLKKSALSRQAVIAIWDPVHDEKDGKDKPCNDLLVFSNRHGALDLNVTIRSNDAIWGWSGINAFEWSMLQEIVARCVGVSVGMLHFNIVSFHVYEPHWAKAREISNTMDLQYFGDMIQWQPESTDLDDVDALIAEWFRVEQLIRTGDPAASANVSAFHEPLWQSWLRVLQWWWTGDTSWVTNLNPGVDVSFGLPYSIKPKRDESIVSEAQVRDADRSTEAFINYVHELHVGKNAAYGDSWKKRGEIVGILANVARKVDRLAVGGSTPDETQTDTAIDLLVYLAKYRDWLTAPGTRGPSSHTDVVRTIIVASGERASTYVDETAVSAISEINLRLGYAEEYVIANMGDRHRNVDAMLDHAFNLAFLYWTEQQ